MSSKKCKERKLRKGDVVACVLRYNKCIYLGILKSKILKGAPAKK
jgi:hypothetical protein